MSDKKQARFSKPRDHILLRAQKLVRKPKPARKRKKKGPFPQRGTSKYQKLARKMSELHTDSISRTKILENPRIHFVIELSDRLTWKAIANSIVKLDVSIVDYLSDKVIRVSVEKRLYERFLSNLEKNYKYIQNIRSIGLFEKIDSGFQEEIRRNPDGKSWVSFEFSCISGVENAKLIGDALESWITNGKYGTIKKTYQSETTMLFSGFLLNQSVETIVKEIESLSYVAKIPEMKLEEMASGARRA